MDRIYLVRENTRSGLPGMKLTPQYNFHPFGIVKSAQMKYSWNWLCDYVDLSGISPETVAQRFTMTVAELEGIEKIGEGLENVVVGRIVSCEPHPDSTKLKVISVDVGTSVVSERQDKD